VYAPLKKQPVDDKTMLRVAKIASVGIALFSFAVAPLLQYAPEGLWQLIRMFTGFYNIPVIAVVIVGLFTTRVPALGAKVAIIFHVIAYGLLRFVFDEDVTIHFLHVYAILFAIEVAIMLVIGSLRPRSEDWSYQPRRLLDLTPWRFAIPCAATLMSCVVALYLLFSPIGLVGGLSAAFWPLMGLLLLINILVWAWQANKQPQAAQVLS
jgi:SSS family solute:Na+ symporter